MSDETKTEDAPEVAAHLVQEEIAEVTPETLFAHYQRTAAKLEKALAERGDLLRMVEDQEAEIAKVDEELTGLRLALLEFLTGGPTGSRLPNEPQA